MIEDHESFENEPAAESMDFIDDALMALDLGRHEHVTIIWHQNSKLQHASYCVDNMEQLEWFERQWRSMYNRIRDRLIKNNDNQN